MLLQARCLSVAHNVCQHADSEKDNGTADQLNPLLQTPIPDTGQQDQAGTPAPRHTAQAVLRQARISPIKLNQFAEVIRRLHISDTLSQCRLSPRKSARLCYKVTAAFTALDACKFQCCSEHLLLHIIHLPGFSSCGKELCMQCCNVVFICAGAGIGESKCC